MRLIAVTLWLLAGAAATGAVYWAFLNTPESTIFALGASALLALTAVAVLSFTINGAIAMWSSRPSAGLAKRSLRWIPAIAPALLVFALLWWIADRIDMWVAPRAGPINAWFIARFGWDDARWLFTAARWLTMWMRWVIGGLLAVSLMAGVANIGWRAMTEAAWVRRGIRPRALAVATLSFVALIVLPWSYLVPWRPEWVPPTRAEMAFIVVKLSMAAFLMAAGIALMIREAATIRPTPSDPAAVELAA